MGAKRRQAILDEIERAWPNIVAAQEAFKSQAPDHKYLQAVKSNRPDDKPPHRQHLPSWKDLDVAGIWGHGKDKMDGVYEIDEYQGPLGDGFVVRCDLEDDDGRFTLAVQHGPHAELHHDWALVR